MIDGNANNRLELLAPAGNLEAFWAALAAGADAVYLGGPVHNARLGSENFTMDELSKAVESARIRSKKVYVTVNTLIDRAEFSDLNKYLEKLQQLQVDAIIVQDLGLLSLVRSEFPSLRVHASTQMFVHNAAGLEFLHSCGVKRAVLPREMTLSEIAAVNEAGTGVETEVFVHGALCYSYSGNCLFSSMVGGRSANRGRCAQPCRLAYRLMANNQPITEGKGRHVLSMADLCAIDQLRELEAAGVSALKIEGRMKRPEYVAIITACYRQALDWLYKENERYDSDKDRRDMARIFNRRFTSAYLDGNRRQLISSYRPNNRGVYAGRVVEQDQALNVTIKLAETVRTGDGLVIWNQGKPAAFTIESMLCSGAEAAGAEAGELIELGLRQRVQANDRVFKTHDKELLDRARQMIDGEKARKVGVRARLVMAEGEPLTIRLIDANGHQAEARSRQPLAKAQKTSLPPEIIADKMSKTGNTPFEMVEMRLDGEIDLFIPLSDLNETRRQAFDALLKTYFEPLSEVGDEPANPAAATTPASSNSDTVASLPGGQHPALLSVMTVNPGQAHAAIEHGASRVYLAVSGPGGYRLNETDLLAVLQDARDHRVDLFLALPWFTLAGSADIMKRWADAGAASFLAGNLGDIWTAVQEGYEIAADYSLNVYNPRTLQVLLGMGAASVCLSQELNASQIKGFPATDRVEAIVHGDVAVMVSRCCILKDDLPKEQQQCRGTCRQSAYSLQDQKGYSFPIEFDGYCNQYVYNSRTLCAVEDLPRLKNHLPAWIRIQAERYTPGQIEGLLPLWQKYAGLVQSRPEIPKSVAEEYRGRMQAFSNMPLTRGHWHRGLLQA